MNMSKLENIITSIRDILRKEGITGMDSINHCISFIISFIIGITRQTKTYETVQHQTT